MQAVVSLMCCSHYNGGLLALLLPIGFLIGYYLTGVVRVAMQRRREAAARRPPKVRVIRG